MFNPKELQWKQLVISGPSKVIPEEKKDVIVISKHSRYKVIFGHLLFDYNQYGKLDYLWVNNIPDLGFEDLACDGDWWAYIPEEI